MSIYRNQTTVSEWYGSSVTIPQLNSSKFIPFASSCLGIAISLLDKKTNKKLSVGLSPEVQTAYANPDKNLIVISNRFMSGDFSAIGANSKLNAPKTVGAILGIIVHEIGHFAYSPSDLSGYVRYINQHTTRRFSLDIAKRVANVLEDIHIEYQIARLAPTLSWTLDEINKLMLTDKLFSQTIRQMKSTKDASDWNGILNFLLFAKIVKSPKRISPFAANLFALARSVCQMTKLQDRFALALAIYNLIAPDAPSVAPKSDPSKSPKSEPDESPENQPEPDNNESGESEPDPSEDDATEPSEDNTDPSEDDSNDDDGSGSEDDSEDDTEDTEDDSNDGDSDGSMNDTDDVTDDLEDTEDESPIDDDSDDSEDDSEDDFDDDDSEDTEDDSEDTEDDFDDDDFDDDDSDLDGSGSDSDDDESEDDSDSDDGDSDGSDSEDTEDESDSDGSGSEDESDNDGSGESEPDDSDIASVGDGDSQSEAIRTIDTFEARENSPIPDYRELSTELGYKPSLDGHTVVNEIIQPSANAIEMDKRYSKLSEMARQKTNANIGYGEQKSRGRDMRQLYRIVTDHKVFSTRVIQPTVKPMEVIIILDCSGSMEWKCAGTSEPKILNASRAVLGASVGLLNGKCTVNVFGHTSDENWNSEKQLIIYPLLQTGESINTLARRLFEINYPSVKPDYLFFNRDGYALFEISKRFSSVNRQRVMIVISDGAPNGRGNDYDGLGAKMHTKKIVDSIRADGTKVFSISIDAQAFATNNYIYGEKFNTCAPDANAIDTLIRQLYS